MLQFADDSLLRFSSSAMTIESLLCKDVFGLENIEARCDIRYDSLSALKNGSTGGQFNLART